MIPYTFAPTVSQPGMMAQTQPGMASQSQPDLLNYSAPKQNNSNGGLMAVFVNSQEEVDNYPVAAGLTVMLISFPLQKYWLKSTSLNGIPEQLRTFEFTEVTPKPAPDPNVVSRDEFNSLNDKLDKLIKSLGGNDAI